MKAAQITKYGGQDAIQLQNNVSVPQMSEGKVLITVHAAALNPFDWKVREGYMKDMMPLTLPATVGGDFSGVVTEVGTGVHYKKGDAVYGHSGTYSGGGSVAEFVVSDPGALAPKPKSLNDAEAAAVPLTAVSAWQAIVEHINLQKGQKVLIHGGAGGIGSFAIQLAKYLGAHVVATASTEEIAYVKDLGADEVIDYKHEKFEEKIHDFDAVFDTVGGDTLVRSFTVLKKGGRLVSMVGQAHPDLEQQHDVKFIAQASKVTAPRLSKISELIEQGVLTVHVDKVFPLDQAPEALEYLKTGHPKGKVVVQIR